MGSFEENPFLYVALTLSCFGALFWLGYVNTKIDD